MNSAVPLRLDIFKQHLVAKAHKFPQRTDVDRRPSQQYLQVGAVQFFHAFRCIHQLINDVGHMAVPPLFATIARKEAKP